MRKRQRGASLIETMIAVGILGAIAYFVTGMIRNGTMGQRALQSSDDARTMTDNMAAILSDTTACANTFVPGGTPKFDPAAGFSITDIKDGSSSPVGGNIAYQVNHDYSTKALTLASITVGGSGTDAKSGIMKWTPLSLGSGGTAFVQVIWKQAHPAQNGGSPQQISKFFLLNALTMLGTNIASCKAQAVGGGGDSLWTKIGNDIYNNNTGAVMIGNQVPDPNAVFDVWANNQRSFFVDNQGKVGIGTNTPFDVFEVKKSSNAGIAFNSRNAGSGGVLTFTRASDGVYASSIGMSAGPTDDMVLSTAGGASQLRFNALAGFGFYIGQTDTAMFANTRPAPKVVIDSSGNMGIGVTVPAYLLDVGGDVQATSFISTSDERLKTDVHQVEGLSKILALRGVRFRWIKDGVASIGLIAQEVEKVFPELVSTAKTTGLKAVRYDALVGPLIEAVKELYGMCRQALFVSAENSKKVKELELRVSASDAAIRVLEQRLDQQSNELAALKARMNSQ